MPGGILAPRKNAPAVMRWCPVKTIMAKVSTDEKDDADLDDAEAPDEDRDEADSSEEEEEAGAEERTSDEGKPAEGSAPLAIREPSPDGEGEGQEEEEEEEEGAATQLGVQRYVLAAFFASGIVGAYILGKAILAVVLVIRTYRKATVRVWADEVANELAKVKWPTRKEVSSSTMVVIAAGAIATIYLALLDRLWSFITDLLYGSGS